MSTAKANSFKFPFIFAVRELINLDLEGRDPKKQYVDAAVKVLSRGFNTDTNCSITLGLVGAALGYNNTPNYFRDKILSCERKKSGKRSRDYWSGGIVEMVNNLLKDGPIFLD